jgi:hypothetical protein
VDYLFFLKIHEIQENKNILYISLAGMRKNVALGFHEMQDTKS